MVQRQVPITVASGVSLTSGTLTYWLTSNPNAVTTLNANTTASGIIGTFDGPLLANGGYTIQLNANANGTTQVSQITVSVFGDNKPSRKDTQTIMHHYLIMLLSTDWFFPFWSEVGLDLDPKTKTEMQRGCREVMRVAIVKTAVDDEGEFEYIDWAEEAKSKAKSMLLQLIDRLGVGSVASSVFQEWNNWNDDDVRSALMLGMLTHELIAGTSTGGSPVPDFSIRVAVMESSAVYDFDPGQFEEIAEKSTSTWDKYLESLLLLDEMPTKLTDHLQPAVNMHRLRMHWNRVSERLTAEQREELLSWYRQMVKSRGLASGALPSFVSDTHVHKSA